MIKPQSIVLAGPMQIAGAIRELGRALAHISDFSSFVEILESSLNKTGLFEGVEIVLADGENRDGLFSSSRITVPLAGGSSNQGILRISPPARSRVFGPEDLHLVSSLGAIVGILVEHVRKHREVQRDVELLSLLLNLAPVGLVAIDDNGNTLFVNNLASRWFGSSNVSLNLDEALKVAQPSYDRNGQTRFHLRLDGKLIFGEAVNVNSIEGARGGAVVITLVDLTLEQGRLIDILQREVYRCRWLKEPLSFVLLESKRLIGGLLQRMGDIRQNLEANEAVGPYDAFRIGMVFPERDRADAVRRVRSLLRLCEADDLQVAIVSPTEDCTAEELFVSALGKMGSVNLVLRRSLLLHDDYPAVNDMLALVLGRSYDIVKSSRIEESMALLRTRSFDGLITEVELRAGGSGLELARLAKNLHPSIRPIFTTVAHSTHLDLDEPLLVDHIILRKPFDVKQLEETIRAALP